jgi:hypothetical protein
LGIIRRAIESPLIPSCATTAIPSRPVRYAIGTSWRKPRDVESPEDVGSTAGAEDVVGIDYIVGILWAEGGAAIAGT